VIEHETETERIVAIEQEVVTEREQDEQEITIDDEGNVGDDSQGPVGNDVVDGVVEPLGITDDEEEDNDNSWITGSRASYTLYHKTKVLEVLDESGGISLTSKLMKISRKYIQRWKKQSHVFVFC
jgi:hypothetical protein